MKDNVVTKTNRRYDIDWLRVLAVLLLFFYHPARIFYLWGGWYIENNQKSLSISLIALFTEHWHMALLFLLAGASTYYALGIRKAGQYIKERFIRLLIPLIFGLLILVPPQIYMDLLHNNRITVDTVSYWQFYPDFFSGKYTDGFDMGHLWFIAYLFMFSLFLLPLFLYLRRNSGKRLIENLASFFSRPGMIFLLALPVMLANYLMLHFYPNPIYYLVIFFYGFLLMADVRFEESIAKHKGIALVFGLVIYTGWISLVRLEVISPDLLQPIPEDLIAWCSLIAILGYGKKFLDFTNRFLKHTGQASYPLYILHQTIIIAIAYYVVEWDAGVLVKFGTIVVSSLAATTLVYELVKRFNITRFLLGMRLLKKDS